MSNLVRRLKKDEYLFREGDASEELYVIKSGKIAIVKAKGSGEILLAEKATGQMVGEMAFFDNRARSAGAKSIGDTEVLVLPFSALNQQYKNFPDWLKTMVKTINGQLREANSRIKNLETTTVVEEEFFTPHQITRLFAIISLVGYKAGLVFSHALLREYCIQIFQQPTNKMDRLLEVLADMRLLKVDDLGEGQKRVTLLDHKLITEFTDWYNRWLFADEEKRVTILEREMNALRVLDHYGRQLTADAQGFVTVDLTRVQTQSLNDLAVGFAVNEADPFVEKGLAEEKRTGDAGALTMKINLNGMTSILPFWEIVHALKKVKR